jgi:hypothetical protein
LNVATFTHRVNLEMLKFFNKFMTFSKLGSGQLPFLGSWPFLVDGGEKVSSIRKIYVVLRRTRFLADSQKTGFCYVMRSFHSQKMIPGKRQKFNKISR